MKNEISLVLKLLEAGNTEKALFEAKKLYQINENNLNTVKVLVYAYIQLGNFEKVIFLLDKHFRLKKENQDFDYHNNLGYALSQTEDYERAIPHLEQAIALQPKNMTGYTNLATIYQKLRKFIEAQKYIYKSLSLVNELGPAHYTRYSNIFLLLTEINSSLGQDEKTVELFNKILNEQFNENIFYLLTITKPNSVNSNLIKIAESHLNSNLEIHQSKLERFNHVTPIYFGLGNFYQSLDKKKSESFYEGGNQEIFNSSKYNSHSYQQKILKIIEYFEQYLEGYDESDDDAGSKNFFIVGSPRSGTTLVESIVSANDVTFSGGELTSAKNLFEKQIFSTRPDFTEFKYVFQTKYLHRSSFLKQEKEYLIDKMPENFLFIGFLSKILPRSKIIRVLRNPWDIATSLFKQRYIINIPYSSSFFNIGVFLANFEAINVYWSKKIQKPGALLDLKYEDLVSNKNEYQRKIYEFLEIPSDEYNEEKRLAFFSPTASIRQVKSKIHQNSINKEEFQHKKQEFYDAFHMQRLFWLKKGIIEENSGLYGDFTDYLK